MRKTAEERVLGVLSFVLDARRPVTAAEIFEAFPSEYGGSKEARDRKFTRDKELLRELGFPLEYRDVELDDDDEPSGAGPKVFANQDGAYVLDRESCFLSKLDLLPEERVALFAVGAAAREGPFPLRGELARALSKLRAVSKDGEETASPGAWAISAPDPAGRDLEMEALLMKAVEERRRVRFFYPPGEKERLVDPYVFSGRRGRFKLVGFCHLRGAVRTFSPEGIERCVLDAPTGSGGEFEVPEAFNTSPFLPLYPWQFHRHAPVEVHVEFSEEMAVAGPQLLGWLPGERPQVTNLEGLAAGILSLGSGVRLVGPPEAREALREVIDALVQAHGEGASTQEEG